MTKNKKFETCIYSDLIHSNFEFVSDFDIRISSFVINGSSEMMGD